MKKHFICLANSYKRGGRCLGGIEILLNKNNYSIVRNPDNSPKWLRPVARTQYGELPATVTNDFRLLDIIEIDGVEPCPDRAHSENVYYTDLRRVSCCEKNIDSMNNLCNKVERKVFFNRGKAVPSDVFAEKDFSLMLIKTNGHKFYFDEKEKLRITFCHNITEYNLPVTDPIIIDEAQNNLIELNKKEDIFLILSLGEVWDEFHYKLVAGVIYF